MQCGQANGKKVIGDRARVSVAVKVPPSLAFEIFTEDIDQWWRRGIKFRTSGSRSGLLRLEAGVGGRLFESFDREGTAHIIEVGRVQLWEPPRCLMFTWRNANFAPHEQTQVQVDFAAIESGTLVTVTHSGLSALRADHPARHGIHSDDRPLVGRANEFAAPAVCRKTLIVRE
jgi:uncharacterized protein YndB with AHSA1/START domain